MFENEFLVRCLLFDEEAASSYADIVAIRTRIGLPIMLEDAQIAAIVLTRCLVHARGVLAILPWRALPANTPGGMPPIDAKIF